MIESHSLKSVMRRVPHPQPASFDPPIYGREKLRSASFTTQLRPVSLSSNNTRVKQTAQECMLELLTIAGPEGMDIGRLARKVSVSVFEKFGCKYFAENVFLELINTGPFLREGGRVFYVKAEEKPSALIPHVPPSVGQIKMEKMEKTLSPAISHERLDKISRSADYSFEHQTPSPSSKVRQPFAPAEYMLNREDSESFNQDDTKTDPDKSVENIIADLRKPETPSKLKDSQAKAKNDYRDENYPRLFTGHSTEGLDTETETDAKTVSAHGPDPNRPNMLLDLIVEIIARAAGHPLPIEQLLTEVIKLGEYATAEIVLAIENGPFIISELAQVNYVPEMDTTSARQSKYRTLINTVQAI